MLAVSIRDAATTIRLTCRVSDQGLGSLSEQVRSEIAPRDACVVEGTLNGFPFRSPVVDREGDFFIALTPGQYKAVGARADEPLALEITRIGDTPEVRVPADLLEALAASPEAAALWVEITPMARREWVRWIASAKQEETRARRIEVGIDKLRGGMRRPCCFPGLNWVTKDHVSPDETWAPLPGGKKR